MSQNDTNYQLQGVIDTVYDDRAMKVNGERMGAPFRKTLNDVTTGGVLAPGAQVLITYTQRPDKNGKVWNNAQSIQVLAAGQAAAPQAAAMGAYNQAPAAGAGPAHVAAQPPAAPAATGLRPNPQYRSPDEMIRETALREAREFYNLVGMPEDLTTAQGLVKVAKLAGLWEAFITGNVTVAEIVSTFGTQSEAVPQDVAVPVEQNQPVTVPAGEALPAATAQEQAPAEQAPAPSPAATAAAEAATAGDAGAAAASALDAFIGSV